jgi:hypothetical protein
MLKQSSNCMQQLPVDDAGQKFKLPTASATILLMVLQHCLH